MRGRPGFGPIEHRVFDHVERLRPDDLAGARESFSFVALLPDAERARVLATAGELAREAVDADGLLTLPYRLMVARAVVGIR